MLYADSSDVIRAMSDQCNTQMGRAIDNNSYLCNLSAESQYKILYTVFDTKKLQIYKNKISVSVYFVKIVLIIIKQKTSNKYLHLIRITL